MDIDSAQFGTIVRAVYATDYRDGGLLTTDDAIATIGIAQLVVGADRMEDSDELTLLDQVIGQLCKLAGISPDAVPASQGALPTDDDDRRERLRGLGSQLSNKGSRELAYAMAYLVSIADLELAPAESDLIEDLAVALGISEDRSDEIVEAVAEAITPPE